MGSSGNNNEQQRARKTIMTTKKQPEQLTNDNELLAEMQKLTAELQKEKEAKKALNAENKKLTAENKRLKKNQRPKDALVIGCNLVFQKGTHQDLVGKKIKGEITPESIGNWTISGVVKHNERTGNCYVWSTGWIHTDRLELNVDSTSTDNSGSKSLADVVGLSK